MPQIYTAFASEVKVNEETIEGLQSIEYEYVKNRHDVGAIGTDERVAVYFGMKTVRGQLSIASGSTLLDQFLDTGESFSISSTLRHGDTERRVTFDECFLDDKSFALASEGHAETVYRFTATRVREE